MDYFKKIETIAIIVVIVILGAAYGVLKSDVQAPTDNVDSESDMMIQSQPSESSVNEPVQQVPNVSQIKYAGEDGRNAMELLKANYNVETQTFGGVGEFVKSIDGIQPDSSHFWAFYVNGQIAQVGAEAFVTTSLDEIEWKLEQIQ